MPWYISLGSKLLANLSVSHLNTIEPTLPQRLNLCESMLRHGVRNLAFSSSATVYGEPESMPLRRRAVPVIDATNPYGRTKLMIEKILADVSASEPSLNVALLRYFNPGGAHISGEIGEDPTGIPNNLLPFVSQVAVGKREELVVFGGDYPTDDGTCIRDYIHVVDLAKGHLAAVEKLTQNPGLITCNLGTGTGYSVLDIIHAFEKANDLKIPYRVGPRRREGDIPSSYTDPAYAKTLLGWEAKLRYRRDLSRRLALAKQKPKWVSFIERLSHICLSIEDAGTHRYFRTDTAS